VVILVRQQTEVEGSVAVIDGGGEFERADHGRARVLFLGLVVVHGGEEIDVILGLVGGKCMAEHGGAHPGRGDLEVLPGDAHDRVLAVQFPEDPTGQHVQGCGPEGLDHLGSL